MKVRNPIRLKIGIFILLPLILFVGNPSILTAQQHGDLIRAQGEEKIYLIQSGQRRAIATEGVFRQMGFKMEDVKELDPQTVMNIPEGPPLWSKEIIAPYPDGTLIRLKDKAQAYVIRGGRKCFVPDAETFQAYGFQWDQVIEVDQSTFNKIPTGIPIASVKSRFQYGQPGIPPPAIGTPGTPSSPYPPQPYPPSTYPPQTYPPPSSPPPQPYPYPPPGSPAPSYPPSSAPPPYPPPPSYPPSTPPPSKPSSHFPGGPVFLVEKFSVTLTAVDFIRTGEKTGSYIFSQVLGGTV